MGELFDLAPRVPPEWGPVEVHYRDYADALRRYVRRVAFDRGLSESLVDIEGVVHEAFLSMVSSSNTINAPRAWLFAVARYLVSDIAAQHQHRRVGGDPHDLLETGAARWSSLTPWSSAEHRFKARRVLEALGELPDRQKKAVYLHRVEGWTSKEIADFLDIKEDTVRVHVHKGTKRLRELAAFKGLKMIIGVVVTAIAGFLERLSEDSRWRGAAVLAPLIVRPKQERQPGESGHRRSHPLAEFAKQLKPSREERYRLVKAAFVLLLAAGFFVLLALISESRAW